MQKLKKGSRPQGVKGVLGTKLSLGRVSKVCEISSGIIVKFQPIYGLHWGVTKQPWRVQISTITQAVSLSARQTWRGGAGQGCTGL